MGTKLTNKEIQDRLKKEAEEKLAKKSKQLQDQKEIKK
jgi:hypothetical protein